MTKKWKYIVWIVGILMLATVITLGVYVGIFAKEKDKYMRDIDNYYQSSYYNLVTNFVDIENDLAKAKVMSDSKILKQTLMKINVNCNLAEQNLAIFNTASIKLDNLLKFVNQLGDYSFYVIKELDTGKKMTTSQIQTLNKLWGVSKEYGKILNQMKGYADKGYSFSQMLGANNKNFGDIIGEINQGSIEYPSLIYDGPFSDGVQKREAKGVVGEVITSEQGKKFVQKYLVGYDIEKINLVSESNNRIPSFLYEVQLKGSRRCNIQIAKKGGLMLMMDLFHETEDPKLTVEQCKKVAEQYCEAIGLPKMTAVWINNNQSTVYINMCYEQNGIINYPDMVKLKISLDTGEVIGYEGLNYAFNHIAREYKKPTISEEDAVINVSAIMQNLQVRLVVIPWQVTKEKLAYEIVGELDNEKYFVYVDAFTGDELNVLRMIDSNQGELLMWKNKRLIWYQSFLFLKDM